MDRIVLKKQEPTNKTRRAAVTVKPQTYKRISDLAFDLNMTIEDVVNILLEQVLEYVEVEE